MSDRENTKEVLLDHLVYLLDNEPPDDAGSHPAIEVHERVGAAWAEWDKQVAGLRVVLASMLINDAIKARQEQNND